MIKLTALLAVPLAALLIATASAQDKSDTTKGGSGSTGGNGSVYKIVGPDGRVTFSDTAPAGEKVEKIEIGPINVQPIAPKSALPTRKLSPRSGDERQREDLGPISFAIVSPADDATIPPGQRFIVLQVALSPVPRDGYRFFAVIDGQRWSGGSSTNSLDISALERGTHTIQAVLYSATGQPLAQSQTIQVHVKRPGGQIPDFPAQQAPQMPQAPQVPGIAKPPSPQPR
ncbi:DUF4124 domain-containing protein [Microbulbifer agarilyticus]|uniref:DUF4124 domain-containing protein n=1 Tax=Microbulbifer agarilyticus TaxID=260552 RepID=UPI001CD39C68|nr:DUF4124 domain-containing protein [Microbulbifer agarilyticus]MCA0893352.1 DUF4124 domain-containing protein [Microbulbifer agarilyticus]